MAVTTKLSKQPKVRSYPKLMIGVSSGNIALFKDAESATYLLLIRNHARRTAGSPVEELESTCWKDYTGEITLSNK